MKHAAVLGLTCLLLLAAGANAGTDRLRHNPFEQPDMKSGRTQANANKTVVTEMKLRATLIDGHDSLVNISGKFYRLNQEISGFRVIGIKSTSVTLRRGNNETILTLNNDEQM